jgi:hypothetical protein
MDQRRKWNIKIFINFIQQLEPILCRPGRHGFRSPTPAETGADTGRIDTENIHISTR